MPVSFKSTFIIIGHKFTVVMVLICLIMFVSLYLNKSIIVIYVTWAIIGVSLKQVRKISVHIYSRPIPDFYTCLQCIESPTRHLLIYY